MELMSVILIGSDGLSKMVQVEKSKKLVVKTLTSHDTVRAYLFFAWYESKFFKGGKIRVFKEAKFYGDYVKIAEDLQETVLK